MLPWILALLLAVAVASPATSMARPRDDCRTRGTTIEANASARLFSTFNRVSRARVYRACRLATRRAVYIGRRDMDSGVPDTLDLSGFHVLYEVLTCHRDSGCGVEVRLRDIRTGPSPQVVEQLHSPAAAATDLVLTRDLTAVWIRPGGSREVVRDRPTEAPTVLASGPAIELGSLATVGNRIYWTNAGKPESALTR